MEDRDLIVGKFYWILPDLDPSHDENWRSQPQPARFRGYSDHNTTQWDFIGAAEGESEWSVQWVGPEIVSP